MQSSKFKVQSYNSKTLLRGISAKYKILSFALSLCVLSFALCTPPVYAQTPEPWPSPRCIQEHIVKYKDQAEVEKEERIQVATIQGFECLFKNIVRILTPIAGLAVFIMFILGAFQMITAGGEAKQLQKARKTLTAAVLGLVVFVGIWFILKLIQAITGVDVTKFEIPGP